MKEFFELVEVSDRLNHPETGCPWDIKQNFESLQKYIIEEACELYDAVEDQNKDEIIEELGDLLYVVIFYSKVAEKEGKFTLQKVLKTLTEKLIRRHPHVFGKEVCQTKEDVEKKWQEIKKIEKSERKSALDGIPRSLTALARTQKILSKILEHECDHILDISKKAPIEEKELADHLIELTLRAQACDLDAEKILRRAISEHEQKFRDWEKTHKKN